MDHPSTPGGETAPVSLYNATVRHRIEITPRLSIFQVTPDGGMMPFVPGQFTVLGLTHAAPRTPEAEPDDFPPEKAQRLIRRAYSISSGSNMREYLEFFVSQVTSGQLTPRLFCLQPGDRLFVGSKASGLFTLDQVPADRNILLIATGTGLAPYMSMVRTQVLGLDACPRRPMAVLQGASYSWDLGYRGELETLQRHCAHFRYLPVVSRPAGDPAWQGATGRLTGWLDDPGFEEWIGFPLDPGHTSILLCGNPGMIDEAQLILTKRGYAQGTREAPGSMHTEKYW